MCSARLWLLVGRNQAISRRQCSRMTSQSHMAATILACFPVLGDLAPCLGEWHQPSPGFPGQKRGVVPESAHPALVHSVARDRGSFLLDVSCRSRSLFSSSLQLTPAARVTFLEWRSDKAFPFFGAFHGLCAHISLGSPGTPVYLLSLDLSLGISLLSLIPHPRCAQQV